LWRRALIRQTAANLGGDVIPADVPDNRPGGLSNRSRSGPLAAVGKLAFDQSGVTAIEYAFIAGLVAIAIVTAVTTSRSSRELAERRALLVPVALVAGGRWRAFAAALGGAGSLCALSLAVFGWPTWHAFLTAAAGSRDVYASGRIPFGGFVTPFGAAMLVGASRALAGTLQAGATLVAAGLVAWVWRRALPLPIRAASLASATLVAVPLALFYDLVLAGVAAAWLLQDSGHHHLPEWGKLGLVGLYVLSLNPRGIAAAWHLPLGPFIAVALMALTIATALRDTSARDVLTNGPPA
jgi:Flp/Fap pilin component